MSATSHHNLPCPESCGKLNLHFLQTCSSLNTNDTIILWKTAYLFHLFTARNHRVLAIDFSRRVFWSFFRNLPHLRYYTLSCRYLITSTEFLQYTLLVSEPFLIVYFLTPIQLFPKEWQFITNYTHTHTFIDLSIFPTSQGTCWIQQIVTKRVPYAQANTKEAKMQTSEFTP